MAKLKKRAVGSIVGLGAASYGIGKAVSHQAAKRRPLEKARKMAEKSYKQNKQRRIDKSKGYK